MEFGSWRVRSPARAGRRIDQSVDDRDIGVIQRSENLGFAVEMRQTFGREEEP